MVKEKKVELFSDDTPPDLESFSAKYSDEEIEQMFQKLFGDYIPPASEEE